MLAAGAASLKGGLLQVVLYGMLPQTITKNPASILYRREVCMKATVVVGLVGARGLGIEANC